MSDPNFSVQTHTDSNKPIWSQWFFAGRLVSPEDLHFRVDQDRLVILLRQETWSVVILRNIFAILVLSLFALVTLFAMVRIEWQIAFLLLVAVGVYAFSARTRITIDLRASLLTAETCHFGYVTGRTKTRFNSQARFLARMVGLLPSDDYELVFTDGTHTHVCFATTEPQGFDQILSRLNAAVEATERERPLVQG